MIKNGPLIFLFFLSASTYGNMKKCNCSTKMCQIKKTISKQKQKILTMLFWLLLCHDCQVSIVTRKFENRQRKREKAPNTINTWCILKFVFFAFAYSPFFTKLGIWALKIRGLFRVPPWTGTEPSLCKYNPYLSKHYHTTRA